MQQQFDSTRRVAPATPAADADPLDRLKELGALHRSGELSDSEFEAAKAKLLA